MSIKFSFSQYAIAFGIKVLSALCFGILSLGIRIWSTPAQFHTGIAGLQMAFIELLIGLVPAYFVWVLIFLPLRRVIVKQFKGSLMPEIFLALGLNLIEHFLMFGYFGHFIRGIKNHELGQVLQSVLPDFSEFTALALSSIFFTLVYRAIISKKNDLSELSQP